MTDKVALVTGASRGLGAAIAQGLARDGWAVAVNYRSDAAGAERVVAGITDAGGSAAAFAADVTDQDAVRRLVADVTARLGPVTCVVANAVGPHDPVPLAQTTWADHLHQLDHALKSPLMLVQETTAAMTAAGRGRVILIGSDAFDKGNAGDGAYAAAKGAQLGAARTWARELGRHGITVNVVAPGWIPVERHADIPQGDRDSYAASLPLARMGTPDEIAAAVVYLASDGGAFVTGQRLIVNGGHTPGT